MLYTDYSSSSIYFLGSKVQYLAEKYVLVRTSADSVPDDGSIGIQNIYPDSNPWYWKKVNSGLYEIWDNTLPYPKGAKVVFEGKTWIAIQQVDSEIRPGTPNPDANPSYPDAAGWWVEVDADPAFIQEEPVMPSPDEAFQQEILSRIQNVEYTTTDTQVKTSAIYETLIPLVPKIDEVLKLVQCLHAFPNLNDIYSAITTLSRGPRGEIAKGCTLIGVIQRISNPATGNRELLRDSNDMAFPLYYDVLVKGYLGRSSSNTVKLSVTTVINGTSTTNLETISLVSSSGILFGSASLRVVSYPGASVSIEVLEEEGNSFISSHTWYTTAEKWQLLQ